MQVTLITRNRKAVLTWLACCTLLVVLMVAIGGLTRLTESGLSIVEWKPISGALPPLTSAAWENEFSNYQLSPQYVKVNSGMSLAEFKGIFWLEYLHRLLGRIIGLVFFIPLLAFAALRSLSRRFAVRLIAIFLLGGLQGVIGWYMVKSGLVDDPRVNPLRLALHLGTACLLFALLWWHVLRLAAPHRSAWNRPATAAQKWSAWLVGGIFMQIMIGGLVAGLDAGLIFNSFPTMDGQWLPDGLWIMQPAWRNLLENAVTVQFIHRLGALLVTVLAIGTIVGSPRNQLTRWGDTMRYSLIVVLTLQITLGALTVLHAVPITLASLHQMVAILLLATALALHFGCRRGSELAEPRPLEPQHRPIGHPA